MKHELEMQRYIEALRKEAKVTAERHADELEECEAKQFQLMVTGVVVAALLFILCVWLGLSNIDYADQNRQLTQQIDEMGGSNLPQRFDNVLEALQRQNNRVLELEQANGALIEHCRPCDVKRAIKATPLPIIGKEV